MSPELDLRQLAVNRTAPVGREQRRRRAIYSRYVLPAAILIGFSGMVGWAAREHFISAKPVTVVPVVVTRAAVQQSGAELFQAAGWIEPRPTPVIASALAEGVIAELLVVEGREVQAGEPVARLIDADARLSLQRTEADLELRQAEAAGAHATLEAARLRLKFPVHLQATAAEAASQLAKVETDLAKVPFLIEAAGAKAEFASKNLEGKKSAGSGIAGRLIQQAESEYRTALAEQKELQERQPRLQREVRVLGQKQEALAKQLELLVDESRQVADAEAGLKAAEARVQLARLEVQGTQLKLERMVVRSPMCGRVLTLLARPGTRVTGLSPITGQDSSNVVSLYDPQMLQVRADVRLEDVPLVEPGQPVRIETASAKTPLKGTVLSATSTANVQKNTLEVKVAINDPPSTIRPEMLVTATFLAPLRPNAETDQNQQQERLLVPRSLVDSGEAGSAVWIADANGQARRRSIRLGRAGTDELVEVSEGLTPTDKLIASGREGLKAGERIKIMGDDDNLGVAAVGSAKAGARQP